MIETQEKNQEIKDILHKYPSTVQNMV